MLSVCQGKLRKTAKGKVIEEGTERTKLVGQPAKLTEELTTQVKEPGELTGELSLSSLTEEEIQQATQSMAVLETIL